ncbi:MAG: hypothetical protein QOF84_6205 [Streptomyces sp.]|nr:hypothetical protein [Streptomyces sp.]
MATLLRLPEVAAGATEAVLSEWLVKENTPYRTEDPIVVLETDKALVEVAAESDAVILRALVPNGSTVEVGAPIALLGDESEIGADVEQLLAELGVSAGPTDREPTPSTPPEASPSTQVTPAPPVTTESENARVFISPLARRILKEAGLTTDQVRATGPNGRIVRRDVERAVEEARAAAAAAEPVPAAPTPAAPTPAVPAPVPAAPVRTASPQPPTSGYRDIPHTRLRRAVAARLTASKQTVPHFYLKRTARIDELLALRKQLNEVSPQKISVNDLVIGAVAVAHQAVPDANVIWTDEGMRQFESVDVAVAIASERGLVTPVLCAVERMSPSAIAREVKAYVQKANQGTLQQGDLEGGSLTVTNLGMYGVDEFSAIINPPHSAILAVGAGRPGPVVVDGTVQVATQMTLVLSVDHRAIDGALAAQWMEALVGALEQPLRLVA